MKVLKDNERAVFLKSNSEDEFIYCEWTKSCPSEKGIDIKCEQCPAYNGNLKEIDIDRTVGYNEASDWWENQ